MGLKKEYYTLSKDAYQAKLAWIHASPDTKWYLSFSCHPYFYLPSPSVSSLLLKLTSSISTFETLFSSFSSFGRNQIALSYLIQEIQATNEIESIPSTKHDIFCFVEKIKEEKTKKSLHLASTYYSLLKNGGFTPSSLEDIRNCFDSLLGEEISSEDQPDGELFRKGTVALVDGVKPIHNGLPSEAEIRLGLLDFLSCLKEPSFCQLEQTLLSHFLFEAIHPFYDGNGRLGRYLLSSIYYEGSSSPVAFFLSSSLRKNRSKYYKAFQETMDARNKGDLSTFLEGILPLLLETVNEKISELCRKKEAVELLLHQYPKQNKAQAKLLFLLGEASLFSFAGVSMKEILEQTGLSRRMVMYLLKQESQSIEKTRIGQKTYYRLAFKE